MTIITKTLLLLFTTTILMQTGNKITSKAEALFFNLPTKRNAFEMRKEMNKNPNFKKYSENNFSSAKSLNVKFDSNKLMSYIGKNNSLTVAIDNTLKLSIWKQMFITYPVEDITLCEKQFKELTEMFVPLCYWYETYNLLSKDQKIGEGIHFYQDLEDQKKDKVLIEVEYEYSKAEISLGHKACYYLRVVYYERYKK